ncbi:MAG: hypothetical protein GX986_00895 [Firmicutes bacterium]|nr:hypothetical protein [Bacillota bacterium]
MIGNLDKFAGIGQALQPLLLALGKMQSGDGEALKQLKDFVEENAENILQAKPLLESESMVKLVQQFVPNARGNDLKRAVSLLVDMAEQAVKKRR